MMAPNAAMIWLLIWLLPFAAGLQPGSKTQDLTQTSPSADSPFNEAEILKWLLEPVQGVLLKFGKVETLPSCNRLATAGLFETCTSLETPASTEDGAIPIGADILLDDTKSLYGARLAVCELDEAEVHVPQACQLFRPSMRTAGKRTLRGLFGRSGPSQPHETFPEYEVATRENLKQCLQALHDNGKAQGWQSYVANKREAIAMCHALRGYVEKDEQIRLFRFLAETIGPLAETVARSTKELNELFARFQELQKKIPMFSLELVKDNEQKLASMARTWAALGVQIANITNGLQKAQDAVGKLHNGVTEADNMVGISFDRTEVRLANLAQQQSDQLIALGDLATDAVNKMQFEMELILQRTFQNLSQAGLSANAIHNLIIGSQGLVQQSFTTMDNAFQELESRAATVDRLAAALEDALHENLRLTRQSNQEAKETYKILGTVRACLDGIGAAFFYFNKYFWIILACIGCFMTLVFNFSTLRSICPYLRGGRSTHERHDYHA